MLYPTDLPLDKHFLLSKVISLGLVDYVSAKTNHIKVKWPNDIYCQDKKLAGILIENVIKGNSIKQSIVGIGLNLNQTVFTSDAPNPVSLKQITGKNYLIEQEIVKLRSSIRFFYKKLIQNQFEEINTEYLKCLYRFNSTHNYKIKDRLLKAKITGVSEFGYLQIETLENEKLEFDFKEIEFVI